MKRHLLRARRLSLCATAAGLCIAAVSVAPVTADAAPTGERGAPVKGRSNSFLGNILAGNAAANWASRSSWENVFRAGVPSFFGAEFVSVTPYLSGFSPAVISHDTATGQPTLGGFTGITVSGAQLQFAGQGNFSSGAVVKLGSGTLQIGSAGSTNTVSIVNSGSLTISQGSSAPVSGTVINLTSSGTSGNDVQLEPVGATADVVAAAPAASPGSRPKPPKPPGPPVVSR